MYLVIAMKYIDPLHSLWEKKQDLLKIVFSENEILAFYNSSKLIPIGF